MQATARAVAILTTRTTVRFTPALLQDGLAEYIGVYNHNHQDGRSQSRERNQSPHDDGRRLAQMQLVRVASSKMRIQLMGEVGKKAKYLASLKHE